MAGYLNVGRRCCGWRLADLRGIMNQRVRHCCTGTKHIIFSAGDGHTDIRILAVVAASPKVCTALLPSAAVMMAAHPALI